MRHRPQRVRYASSSGPSHLGRTREFTRAATEIADEARELVLRYPVILRKIDPATAIVIVSLKLPGIVDVLADNSTKRAELAELVDEHYAANTRKPAACESTVNSNQTANAQTLANETRLLGQAFVDGHRQLRQDFEGQLATLGCTVIANKADSEQALHEAYTSLWKYFAEQQWWFSQNYDSRSLTLDEKLDTLQAEQNKNRPAAKDRLALLERSPWRKLVDGYHRIVFAESSSSRAARKYSPMASSTRPA